MNFRRINPGRLEGMAANLKTVLEGPQLDSLTPEIRAHVLANLGRLPEILREQNSAVSVAEAQRRHAVSERAGTVEMVQDVMASVKMMLRAVGAPDAHFELCGFDPPAPAAGVYRAADPTNATATISAAGHSELRWKGNNRYRSVLYEIWRCEGRDGTWSSYATAPRQHYTDENVRPGVFYAYRVRAVAANDTSAFSNTAVVYA